MKRIFGISIVIAIEILFLSTWIQCRELKDIFYFSLYNISLIIIDRVHNDADLPLLLVRFFHNKATDTLLEFIKHYFLFWDIRFLLPLISPLGIFSVASGFWYLVQNKIRVVYKFILFALVLATPLFELLLKSSFPFLLRLTILALPYIFLSVYGVWFFLEKKNQHRPIIFIGLLLLSIWWYLVFRNEVFNFCVKL